MIRLLLALAALSLFYAALAAVPPPPGVVARNVTCQVDATPLFYTESDRLAELERALGAGSNIAPAPSSLPPVPVAEQDPDTAAARVVCETP